MLTLTLIKNARFQINCVLRIIDEIDLFTMAFLDSLFGQTSEFALNWILFGKQIESILKFFNHRSYQPDMITINFQACFNEI
jgi:hypothetical protein